MDFIFLARFLNNTATEKNQSFSFSLPPTQSTLEHFDFWTAQINIYVTILWKAIQGKSVWAFAKNRGINSFIWITPYKCSVHQFRLEVKLLKFFFFARLPGPCCLVCAWRSVKRQWDKEHNFSMTNLAKGWLESWGSLHYRLSFDDSLHASDYLRIWEE